MDKLEKAKEVIRDLSENNYAKLKRSLGVGLYLFNLLKDNSRIVISKELAKNIEVQ